MNRNQAKMLAMLARWEAAVERETCEYEAFIGPRISPKQLAANLRHMEQEKSFKPTGVTRPAASLEQVLGTAFIRS